MIKSEILIVEYDSLPRGYRPIDKLDKIAWDVDSRINSTQRYLIEELIQYLKLYLLAAFDEGKEV